MRVKVLMLLLFALMCTIPDASAYMEFTNDIDITDSITFTIKETYTGDDAQEIRQALDADNSSIITSSEIEQFKVAYLNIPGIDFSDHIAIDDGAVPVLIESVGMNFENAEGELSNKILNITTVIVFEGPASIPSGEHELWILGHPLIRKMRITLPAGVDVISVEGLDNFIESKENGRIMLEGRSGVRMSMLGDRAMYEYATVVNIYKKPFYAKSYFLPLLAITELLLAALAVYMIKYKK